MTDIASLGLKIDSAPVQSATEDLNSFRTSAKEAGESAKSFGESATSAGNAAVGLSKQLQSAINSAQEINKRLNVRDDFGTKARAADIEAYGAQINALEAKYAPLVAAEKAYKASLEEINQATKTGVLTTEQQAIAVAVATGEFKKNYKEIDRNQSKLAGLTTTAHLNGNQIAELGHIARSTFGVMANGGSIFQALGYESNRLMSVLTIGNDGVGGTLRAIGGYALGLVKPFWAATAAAAAFATTLGVAYAQAQSRAKETALALSGVGRASGVTADQVEGIAVSAARAGDLTVGAARKMTLALVSTGKISGDLAGQIVGIGATTAKLFGEDLDEATKRLTKAFSDPAKGADELNARLGTLDDKTRQLIRSLTEQNRVGEAQRVLMDSLKAGIELTVDATIASASAWDRAWAAGSRYWDGFVNFIDRATGGGTLEQRLADAQQNLQKAQSRYGENANSSIFDKGTVDAAYQAYLKLAREADKVREASRQTKINLEAAAAVDLARSLAPDVGALEHLKDELAAITAQLSNPDVVKTLSDTSREAMERSVAILKTRINLHQEDIETSLRSQALETRSITARTVADRAQLAFDQKMQQLQSSNFDALQRFQLAQGARQTVVAEANEAEKRFAEERKFNNEQTVEQLKLEASLVGKTTAEAAGLRAQWEYIAEAKKRAFEQGRTLGGAELAGVTSDAESYGASVTGGTLGREGRQLTEDYKSPSEQFADEMTRLNQLRDADAISWQTYYQAKTQAEYAAFQQTEQVLQTERDMRAQTVNAAAGLLQQLGAKNKAAAIAAILLNKALAAASIVQDTARAAMAAAASAAIGGPAAAAAAAASMEALGAIQLGIVAATGALEIGAALKGGGKSGSSASRSSGFGSSSSSALDSSASSNTTEVRPQTIIIQATGSRYSREELREIIMGINDTLRDGTKLQFE